MGRTFTSADTYMDPDSERGSPLDGAHSPQEQPTAAPPGGPTAAAPPGGTTAAAPPGGPTAAGARGGPPRFPAAEARHWELCCKNVPHD